MDPQILEQIINLAFERGKLSATLPPAPEDRYTSPELHELAAALAKAQGNFPVIRVNRENPYWSTGYADFDILIRAVRPCLTEQGLSFVQQQRITPEGSTMLHSVLLHTSGQWIESRARIVPVKNDPHAYGSELQYQKRFALMSLLGISIEQDPFDDDAERSMADHRKTVERGTALNAKYNPRETNKETISKDQLIELEYELQQYPDIIDQIYDAYHIQSLADLPKEKFRASITKVREITNLRNGRK